MKIHFTFSFSPLLFDIIVIYFQKSYRNKQNTYENVSINPNEWDLYKTQIQLYINIVRFAEIYS